MINDRNMIRNIIYSVKNINLCKCCINIDLVINIQMMQKLFFLAFVFPCIVMADPSLKQVGVILHHDISSTNGDLSAYVGKLTDPKCQYISEFNIFSNHLESLEISNLQQFAKTLQIPFNFDLKKPTEPSLKLRIIQGSTAELYYVGSINSKDTCDQIGNYLGFAQAHESAGLIPLVGQFQSTSVITVDNSQKTFERYFNYAQSQRLNHFQIVENIRLISRHTLQLARSNIREIKQMTNHTPICEEIFLNFVMAHFYPELRSRINKFAGKLPSIDFARSTPLKSACVRSFIDILGYCPLFYQKKIFNGKIWKNPNFNKVVELKKVALNAQVLYGTENRLLVPVIQTNAQAQPLIHQFSIIQITILTILFVILTALLTSIILLRAKINSLSLQTKPNLT